MRQSHVQLFLFNQSLTFSFNRPWIFFINLTCVHVLDYCERRFVSINRCHLINYWDTPNTHNISRDFSLCEDTKWEPKRHVKLKNNNNCKNFHVPARIPLDCIHIRHPRLTHRPCGNEDKTHREFKIESYLGKPRNKTSLFLM